VGYITSKDLSGREGLTGVARKQKENKVRLEKAIEDIIQTRVEEEIQKKKKKEPKKKKSTS
tara:strand:- start:502 stop:684 length:183 start_codon:yes stop_codon:yes gene_type:complete